MTVYTYTTIDDPSATNGTYAFGINDLGQIVGYYTDLSNYVHSFLYSGGIYTTIDDPSATNGTYADSINASGQITGGYRDDSGGHGFLYSGGIYTTIDDPSAINGTYADGINASGQITGFYYDGSWGPHGFLYSGGTYTTIDYPSATNVTVPESINDLGQIVGYYDDASGRHGFLYSSGTYTTIDDPSGTNGTVVTSINDLGQITGYYQDASGAHGFLYSSGTYTTIDYPSAANLTVVTSINDLGQITGYYQDASGIHGFLADPIPPVNDHAPVMTTAGIQTVAENTTAVTTVTATDPDAGQALSYSIIGGADAGKFTIGSNTGALSFITAPNFELPTDAGGNNVYDVTVQVSDGHGGTDSQAIAVTVTNTNDVPTITSNGSGAAASVSVLENSTAVTTVAATDPDAGQTLSYSIIGGADAGKFTIASNTGTLSFITAPNFDLPIDVDGNNVYDVTVQISDGVGGVDTQAFAVKVENVVGVSIIGTPSNDLIDATHTVAGQPFPTNEEDTLNGGSGADQMSGGAGNDAYVVDNISDVVTENASAGSDTVYASVDYRLTANVENLVLQGSAAQGYGNALGNAIYGTGGDNILDGDAGADSMYGGAGNDAYFLDNIGDSVFENANEGSDTVYATANYRLGANVEYLVLQGSAVQGYGNSLSNAIYGTSADNLLDGDAGADAMYGGAGNDSYFLDNISDLILENANEGSDTVYASANYRLGANVEYLVLQGSAVQGYGNSLSNAIYGTSADNLLDGDAGADAMYGGAGNDSYFLDNISDLILENANEGSDTVYASANYRLGANVEYLVLQGSAVQGYGNSLSNAIYGTSADNLLDGDAGADAMYGGAGNDSYFLDNISDLILENANEGSDTVYASANYRLGANVEYLVLQGSAVQGYGNSLSNAIYGTSADNLLDGDAGADSMYGGAGNDSYFVDNTGDFVIEYLNEGNDRVYASVNHMLAANVENLSLQGSTDLQGTGNALANNIFGNAGNNTLDGRAGADQLTGNAGDDLFVFRTGQANGDVVIDFAGNGDLTGDSLQFIGFGTAAQGATFTQIGATNQWQIHSGLGGPDEIITFLSGATIHSTDYLFV